MGNTSATGGYLVPEPGLSRKDIEEAIRETIAGITGLRKLYVRPRFEDEPGNIPTRKDTWCAFGIVSRSEPFSQVVHENAGEGTSRVLSHETLDVQVSFFGPDADDMAVRLRMGLQIAQNREGLWDRNIALVQTGPISILPELVALGWRRRADMTITFRRGSYDSPVYGSDAPEGTVNILHATAAESGFRTNR